MMDIVFSACVDMANSALLDRVPGAATYIRFCAEIRSGKSMCVRMRMQIRQNEKEAIHNGMDWI